MFFVRFHLLIFVFLLNYEMLPSPLIFVSHLRHLVFFYSQTFVLHAELQVFSFLLNFFLHLKLQSFFSPLTFVLHLNVLDLDSQGELKPVLLHFIVVKQFLRENQTVDLLLILIFFPNFKSKFRTP